MKNIKNSYIITTQGLLLILFGFILSSCQESGPSASDNRKGRSVRTNVAGQVLPTVTPTASPTPAVRPGASGTANAVFIQSNFCSCLKKKPDILSDCTSFCLNHNDIKPTLYLFTKLGPSIELNDKLQNLRGWCTKALDDGSSGNSTNPACEMVFDDGFTQKSIALDPNTNFGSSNNLIVPIDIITEFNKTFRVFIKEKTSGATSDSIQIRRITEASTVPSLGPLKISPITQFSCVQRVGSISGSNYIFTHAFKNHYYYVDLNVPPTLPGGNPFIACHDTTLYGFTDSPLYPRMEAMPGFFKMWSELDSRFIDQFGYDANGVKDSTKGNGQPDINDILKEKLRQLNVTTNGTYFRALSWLSYPGISNAPRLGYYLVPFLNPDTLRSMCPTQVEYNSSNTEMNVLKEEIGVDTEALYIAQKESECYTDTSSGTAALKPVLDDWILIRESLAKKVWFYNNNGVATEPTDQVQHSNTNIYFYWPADTNSPYVKKANQRMYTIVSPGQVGTISNTACSTTNTAAPSFNQNAPVQTTTLLTDKRLGCIPATLENE